MAQRLSEKALGYSLAIISAASMLLIWIGGSIGIYGGMFEMMSSAHLYFSLGILGLITGMIEAAFWGFISGWFIAGVYNKFA